MGDTFKSNQSSPCKAVRRNSKEKMMIRGMSGGDLLTRQPSFVEMVEDMDPKLLKISQDLSGLKFEKSLTSKEENMYQNHLDIISSCCKTNPVPYLEFTQWLLEVGLGVEAIAVLNIGLDIFNSDERKIAYSDLVLAQLLLIKLATKYFGRYGKLRDLEGLIDLSTENSHVLAVIAPYLQKIRYTAQSEHVYLGSLLLDPTNTAALKGYAHLLIEQGHYRVALRYLYICIHIYTYTNTYIYIYT
jgi:hypothetical protein